MCVTEKWTKSELAEKGKVRFSSKKQSTFFYFGRKGKGTVLIAKGLGYKSQNLLVFIWGISLQLGTIYTN